MSKLKSKKNLSLQEYEDGKVLLDDAIEEDKPVPLLKRTVQEVQYWVFLIILFVGFILGNM